MDLETIHRKGNEIRKNISKGYNEYKEFEGRKYTGMRVGGTHGWYYDRGEWKEKKIAPDRWEFTLLQIKEGLGMLQKAQVFLLEQNITGIFLLIRT